MIQRTRKNIIHAFNQLIKNHDIEQISVEMIIRKADISKATFYRYFNDKYDVMNANYKELLDYYASSGNCKSYLELYELLYKYGIRNWKFLQRAFNTTGYNSFCRFISEYSTNLIVQITMLNRGGAGLTETEKLQCDVFCIGVSFMYRNWIFEKYPLSPAEAAQALYEIMPATLRDYWWITDAAASDS